MKKVIVAIAAVLTLGAAAPEVAEAKPGGCLKYGVGGAIAGHFAGGTAGKALPLGALSAFTSAVARSVWRETVPLNGIDLSDQIVTSGARGLILMQPAVCL